jgi:hypothetical protein
LVLVYDDIFNGPQIVRSNINELPSNPQQAWLPRAMWQNIQVFSAFSGAR